VSKWGNQQIGEGKEHDSLCVFCSFLLTAGSNSKTVLQPVTTLDRRGLVKEVVIAERKGGRRWRKKWEARGFKKVERGEGGWDGRQGRVVSGCIPLAGSL
jgi:hypothetical protein